MHSIHRVPIRSLVDVFEGGVANCPFRVLGRVIFYAEKPLGNDLLSVIRSSGVSVLEGL